MSGSDPVRGRKGLGEGPLLQEGWGLGPEGLGEGMHRGQEG